MKTKYKLFLLAFPILIFGCETLKGSSKYYTSLTSNYYPPKPENYELPVINENETRRSYRIIGQMEFESGRSKKFIMNAIQYNGRLHGADAMIIQKWIKQDNTYVSWNRDWYGPWGYFPYDYPFTGYPYDFGPEIEHYITRKIKVLMIVFLDKATFGYLGFVFEDTRNVPYLEISKVYPGTPVEKGGLKAGDKIKKIGDYQCDKGLGDYLRNGPAYKRGVPYPVEYERNGEERQVTLVAENGEHNPKLNMTLNKATDSG